LQRLIIMENNEKQLEEELSRINSSLVKTNELVAKQQSSSDQLTNTNNDFMRDVNAFQSDHALSLAQAQYEITKLESIINKLPQVSKKLAYIKQIENNYGEYYLFVDYVDFYSGDDAIKAAEEDNKTDAIFNDGVYIRNKNIENSKIQLENNTLIFVYDGGTQKFMGVSEFVSTMKTNLEYRIFKITYVGKSFLILDELYRP
jgi:hypothetical protein